MGCKRPGLTTERPIRGKRGRIGIKGQSEEQGMEPTKRWHGKDQREEGENADGEQNGKCDQKKKVIRRKEGE